MFFVNTLLYDSIHYQNNAVEGIVLTQLYMGKKIKEGKKLPKGAIVTLVVSRKGTTYEVEMPDVIGDPYGIAKRRAESAGLMVGNPIPSETGVERGIVTRQRPAAGRVLQSGDIVDFWVEGYVVPAENEEEQP